MDHVTARKMHRTLEPYHGVVYFAPEPAAAYRELGLRGRSGYFASRSAAMGAVEVDVVVATFFNFYPDLVRGAMDGVWDRVTPEPANSSVPDLYSFVGREAWRTISIGIYSGVA